jgi:hypothetical protein
MPTDAETDITTLIVASCNFAKAPTNGDMTPYFPIMEAFSQSDLNRKSFETSTNVIKLLGSTPRQPHKTVALLKTDL